MIHYRTVAVGDHQIFYREAGDPNQTSLLLLHGFPSSSHMFRNLIPLLADRFHIIAPDLPGFGFSESPPQSQFEYTFDNLATVIEGFTETIGLMRYALYVFDYGAPVGFRLAVAHPERVTAIVSQNGNAYEEGLSDAWDPIRSYWAKPTTENRKALRDALLTYEGTRWQYTHGVSNPEAVAARILYLRRRFIGPSGQQRHSARSLSQLRFESGPVSSFSKVLSRRQATAARHLGQERPFLHTARRRGVPP